MKAKGGFMPSEIQIVEACKYMGWSYEELMDTPSEVVTTVFERMALENKK